MILTLAIEVFKVRPRDLEDWDSIEITEIEAYYLLKDEREQERQRQREAEERAAGVGQGRRTPGTARRRGGRR